VFFWRPAIDRYFSYNVYLLANKLMMINTQCLKIDKQHVQKSFNIVIYVQAKARLTKTKVETIAYIPMVSIHVSQEMRHKFCRSFAVHISKSIYNIHEAW